MQHEVPCKTVSCVPVSLMGVRFGLGNGLTRVNLSLVTAKNHKKNNKKLITQQTTYMVKKGQYC